MNNDIIEIKDEDDMSQIFEPQTKQTNRKGTITFNNHARYQQFEGKFNSNKKASGKGTLIYTDNHEKCVYNGNFNNGSMHGIGKLTAGSKKYDTRYANGTEMKRKESTN